MTITTLYMYCHVAPPVMGVFTARGSISQYNYDLYVTFRGIGCPQKTIVLQRTITHTK